MLKNFPVPTLACWTSPPINSSSLILLTVSLLSWAIPCETSVVILGAEGGWWAFRWVLLSSCSRAPWPSWCYLWLHDLRSHTHTHTEVNQNGYKYRDLICCFMRDVENQDSLLCVHLRSICKLKKQMLGFTTGDKVQSPSSTAKRKRSVQSAPSNKVPYQTYTHTKTNKQNHNWSAKKEHLTEISASEKRRSYKQTATEVHTWGGESKLS
jgi:hypothetical protein